MTFVTGAMPGSIAITLLAGCKTSHMGKSATHSAKQHKMTAPIAPGVVPVNQLKTRRRQRYETHSV